jgi:hydrogenase nickel incorporation protein HypA/HybF
MHELSIAMSILEFAEEEAERRGTRISAIHVEIGPLSGVVKEALLLAYELARANTNLGDCRLVVQELPIVIYCPECRAERAVASVQRLSCAECGAPAFEFIRGKELQVVGLELTS